MVSDDGLRAAKEKMRNEGVPDAAIATFEHYYEQLVAGESGMLPDDDLDQLSDVPSYDDLPGEDEQFVATLLRGIRSYSRDLDGVAKKEG